MLVIHLKLFNFKVNSFAFVNRLCYICKMSSNKEKTTTIRLSKEEYGFLKKQAEHLGLSLSAYMRMCALKNSN